MRPRWPGRRRMKFSPKVLTPSSCRMRWKRSSLSGSREVKETPGSMRPQYGRLVLFRRRDLDSIAAGTITVAFRRWDAPRVRSGGRQRTPVGVIEVDAVERVPDVTEADAAAAGFASRAALL